MRDAGFHEIQLNGKQLVFLFMAATVVAVVIFLCGVMVGRGVARRARRGIRGRSPNKLPSIPRLSAPSPSSSSGSNTGRSTLTADEELTYAGRLEAPTPLAETLKPRRTEAAFRAPRSGCACTRAAFGARRLDRCLTPH